MIDRMIDRKNSSSDYKLLDESVINQSFELTPRNHWRRSIIQAARRRKERRREVIAAIIGIAIVWALLAIIL